MLHGRIINRHGKKLISDSLNGFVCEHHRFNLELLIDELKFNERQVEKCLEKMRGICLEKFNQLSIRKSRKKALIAIDRKLATVIWNILYYQVPFDVNKAKLYDTIKLKAKLGYYKKSKPGWNCSCDKVGYFCGG